MNKKQRKPQDATLRNIRALKKRVEKLEQWCEVLALNVTNLNDAMLEVHPNFYLRKDNAGKLWSVRGKKNG